MPSAFDTIQYLTRMPGKMANVNEPQISVGQLQVSPEPFFEWIMRADQNQWPPGMRPGGSVKKPTFGHTDPRLVEEPFFGGGSPQTAVLVQSGTTPEQQNVINELVRLYDQGAAPPAVRYAPDGEK